MATPHIKAEKGDFAKTVLMPGDPLRAKFIAETFFENPVLVNNVRGIQGYTGTYKGTKVSVMASGMGMPSMAIYSYELFKEFDVENIIRIGTAGASYKLLKKTDMVAEKLGIDLKVGNILSEDNFYHEFDDVNPSWEKMGVLAVEMEAAALYMNAARLGKNALAICTISDHLVKKQYATVEERQTSFTQMMELALGVAVELDKE